MTTARLPVRPYRLLTTPASPDACLAAIAFGTAMAAAPVGVALPVIDGPAIEYWHSLLPLTQGTRDALHYAHNGVVLFGALHIPESQLATDGIARSVWRGYARIESLLQAEGYPHWLRMWNFLARINEGEGDTERYRQFSIGRYTALSLKPGFEQNLPAATAIGSADGGLLVYFLAGKIAGIPVENPRQVAAYAYPRQYGPRSPSFSRATLVPWADGPELLVSGTASVVGHQTLHLGNAMAQMEETFKNLAALLESAQTRSQGANFAPEAFKLYVREGEDATTLAAYCRQQLGAGALLIVVQGDICRRDLLVEIEGHYRST